MHRLNIPLLIILFCLIAGIISSTWLSLDLAQLYYAMSVTMLIALLSHLWSRYSYKSSFPFTIAMLALSFTIGLFTITVHNPRRDAHHFTHRQDTLVHTIGMNILETLKPSKYQDKYIASINQIDHLPASGMILLNISKDATQIPFKVGDNIIAKTKIEALPIARSPYQFDYGNYLKTRDIYGQLRIQYDELYRLQALSGSTVLLWAARFRESVQSALSTYPFTVRQQAVMHALILGQRQEIDRELTEQYAAAGMMHILAVSGLHVGIILLLLRTLTEPLNRRNWKWLRTIIIVSLIWVFAIITGLSPSVLRAATMFTAIQLGSFWGGKGATANALIYSAIILLLFEPKLIYQVGFQLSYLAVAAILWIQPWLSEYWRPRYYILQKLWGVATVTVAAQLGVLPLSLFYFHQFPGLFFISNIVILPLLGMILGAGICVAMLAVLNILPEKLATAFGWVIDRMNQFIGWVAGQESFVVQDITISVFFLIALYTVIIASVALLQQYTYKKLIGCGGALILLMSVITYERSVIPVAHFAVFQQSRTSVFGRLKGKTLELYHNDSTYDQATDYKIKSYRQELALEAIQEDSLHHLFRFRERYILRIDSLGVYDVPDLIPDIIVLTASPKVNLNRLIDCFPNVTIVADGSNYRSYVTRWKATCLKRKIPFHSTYEKGAFVLYK